MRGSKALGSFQAPETWLPNPWQPTNSLDQSGEGEPLSLPTLLFLKDSEDVILMACASHRVAKY